MLMNKLNTTASSSRALGRRVPMAVSTVSSRRSVIFRAQEPQTRPPAQAPVQEQPTSEPAASQGPLSIADQERRATAAVNASMAAAAQAPPGSKQADANSVLNNMNEAINGRAAMMGFLFAIIGEMTTNHGVVSQVVGRYENQELVEKAIAGSDLGFGAVVALTTLGTLMPRLIAGEAPGERNWGPFTPGLEKTLGRVAMMGFAGLLILEDVLGHPLL